MDNTVASAAVAAVVATTITLAVNHFQKAKDAKAQQAEVTDADREGHMRGWYEGRESLFQHFQSTVKPQDFVPTN